MHTNTVCKQREDVDQLKFDVGELKDLLTNSKGEVNHIRRIVLACERDMEDFTAAGAPEGLLCCVLANSC